MPIPPHLIPQLERLRQEAALRAEIDRMKQLAVLQGEKVAQAPVSLPTDKKAEGGQPSLDAMRLAIGGAPQMKPALNRQGMYSPLEKAAMSVPRVKGTPAEFMAEASKQPGFRKEEVEDRKIGLPEQKMTKQEFLGHLGQHPAPQIDVEELSGDNEETHHDEWAMPGGSNYREILLKRPAFKHENALMAAEADLRRENDPYFRQRLQEKVNQLKAIKLKTGEQFNGVMSHFGGTPNILASLRVKDRVGPNGEKILHVDEVQSDWHQKGRKQGYTDEKERQNIVDKLAREEPLTEEEELARQRYLKRNTVPDAPFKKNWHELALKHALGMAVKGGYDGIAITPGEVQADRYDLSKHVGYLAYDPVQQNLQAHGHDRKEVINQSGVKPEDLENYIGKEPAQRLLASEPQNGKHLLEGQDIKVGGEGMKGFYDKIVPTFLNKLGKPHGAQVQMSAMPVTAPKSKNADADDQLLSDLGVQTPAAKKPMLHYFPIPDSMRQQVKTEGLPQYDHGGEVDAEKYFMGEHMAKGGLITKKMNAESAFFPESKE